MTPRPLQFHPSVSRDLRAAQDFYASWQTGGAARVTARIQTTLLLIGRNAEQYPLVHRTYRRALVKKTYFGLFYRIDPTHITVLALLDLRRDPTEIAHLTRRRASKI